VGTTNSDKIDNNINNIIYIKREVPTVPSTNTSNRGIKKKISLKISRGKRATYPPVLAGPSPDFCPPPHSLGIKVSSYLRKTKREI
jgi:hypothetical protein